MTSNLNARRHCASEGVNGRLFAIGGNTISSIQSSISSVQVADITSGTKNYNHFTEIKLFPNPTTEILNWNFEYDLIIVTDSEGKQIETYNGKVNQIDVKHYEQGMYFLIGRFENKWYRSKWIKIKN